MASCAHQSLFPRGSRLAANYQIDIFMWPHLLDGVMLLEPVQWHQEKQSPHSNLSNLFHFSFTMSSLSVGSNQKPKLRTPYLKELNPTDTYPLPDVDNLPWAWVQDPNESFMLMKDGAAAGSNAAATVFKDSDHISVNLCAWHASICWFDTHQQLFCNASKNNANKGKSGSAAKQQRPFLRLSLFRIFVSGPQASIHYRM